MQTFRQLFTLFFFIALFLGVQPVFAETSEQNSIDWPGVYLGFIPCDDCKGIKTTLALNKNNSYLLITQYVGKSEKEIVEKGKFTWGSQEHTIVLTPRNSSTTRQYLVGENALTQLDDHSNLISGGLANRYILRRNELKQSASSHSSH